MMKILLATPYGIHAGGIARWAEHITRYYDATGKKDCDMVLFPMGRKYEDLHSSKFGRIKNGIRDYLIYIKRLKKEMRDKEYDLVHIASSASLGLIKDVFMINVAHKNSAKVVIHFRFGRIPELSEKRNWEWKLLSYVIKKADKVIVLDKASYETLIKEGYKNVCLLPNPVAPRVTDIVGKTGVQERKSRSLLFAGHGLRTKGIFELVEACKQISDIRLKMIGTIQESVKAELYAKSNNAEWLEVCGEQSFENVIKEMLTCDVFVLPTYTEGFPNVILESMACGCAIVTTPVGAIPEMLEEEDGKQYGVLVPPQNTIELKESIERMLNDEALKLECRKNVQLRVNERYNIDAVWRQMVSIWNETLK